MPSHCLLGILDDHVEWEDRKKEGNIAILAASSPPRENENFMIITVRNMIIKNKNKGHHFLYFHAERHAPS
jgi:hypothetical protein